jgi:hypothetical protein
MNRNTFLFLTGILSFDFGAVMFFFPTFGAQLLGLNNDIDILSVLRGMGGLIIGSGLIIYYEILPTIQQSKHFS